MLRRHLPLVALPVLAVAALGASPAPTGAAADQRSGTHERVGLVATHEADAAISATGELLAEADEARVAHYEARLENNGTTTLRDPAISATAVDTGSPACDVSRIEPGGTATCSIHATPTEAELMAGVVVRDVVVTTLQPNGAALVRVAFGVEVDLSTSEPEEPGEPEPGGPEEPGEPGGPDEPGEPGGPETPGQSGGPGAAGGSGVAGPAAGSGASQAIGAAEASVAPRTAEGSSDRATTDRRDRLSDAGTTEAVTLGPRERLSASADGTTAAAGTRPTSVLPLTGSEVSDGLVAAALFAASGVSLLAARLRPRRGAHRR